jgi:hypothetical protein
VLLRLERFTGVPGRITTRGLTSVWLARSTSAEAGRPTTAVPRRARLGSLLPNEAKS